MMLKLDYVPSRCHAIKNVIRGQIEVWMQFRFYHRKLAILSKNLTHTASPSVEWVIQPDYCFASNGPCFSIVIMGSFRERFVWWLIHVHKASILSLLHTDNPGTWCFVVGVDRVSWRPLWFSSLASLLLFSHHPVSSITVIYLSTGDYLLFHIPKVSLCFLPFLLPAFPINTLCPHVLSHWGPHY